MSDILNGLLRRVFKADRCRFSARSFILLSPEFNILVPIYQTHQPSYLVSFLATLFYFTILFLFLVPIRFIKIPTPIF